MAPRASEQAGCSKARGEEQGSKGTLQKRRRKGTLQKGRREGTLPHGRRVKCTLPQGRMLKGTLQKCRRLEGTLQKSRKATRHPAEEQETAGGGRTAGRREGQATNRAPQQLLLDTHHISSWGGLQEALNTEALVLLIQETHALGNKAA